MPALLTDSLLAALVRSGRPFERSDALVRGLRIRRQTAGGPVKWTLWYRRPADPGAATRYRLGDFVREGTGGLTLAAARSAAKSAQARIRDEKNPTDLQRDVQERRKAESARRLAPRPETVQGLVERALAKLILRPATLKEWRRRVKTDLLPAPFMKKPAADLTPDEVESWLEKIAKRSGHTANSARTVLLRCYSWAVEKKKLRGVDGTRLVVSPVATVAKPDPAADEKESERVLSKEELRAVLLALDEIEAQGLRSRVAYADATRLLLLTGVRRSAVLGMKRSEIQGLGSSEGIWTVPGERSKNGKPHLVPLSKQAASVIERRFAAVETNHLFPQFSTDAQAVEAPMTWSSRFVEDLKKRSERLLGRKMEPWKIHGFRSALATNARERLKVSSDVIARLLSHTPPGAKVTRIYDRSELLDERREALRAWANWLDRTKESDDAMVVPMRGRVAS